jgi:riboflavin biosynthesis pyrimidine reductase
LVGGATAAVEPYHLAPHPVIRFSRETCGEVNPLSIFIENLKRKYPGTILCEGGVQLLHLLLKEELIDFAFISRVAIEGDGHFLDEELFQLKMGLISRESINQTTFEEYKRASR